MHRIRQRLEALGLTVFPSATKYLSVELQPGINGLRIWRRLMDNAP
jgi:hypothetical protein